MKSQSRRQFVRTLFIATQAAAVSTLLPRTIFAADAKSGALNFLIFGDWGREGQPEQLQVAAQMGVAAEAIAAKFVISVGDNFYEDGVKSVTDPTWKKSFENIYTAPSLQVPWWVALGNHDYHGNVQAQIDYSQTSPRWRMPGRTFVRTEKIDDTTVADFFYLDTTPMAKAEKEPGIMASSLQGQDPARQVDWLEAQLKASTAPWKIVIAHHPVFSGGVHGDTPYIVKNILPLLEKYGVHAYFNGHDHDLQHLQSGNIHYFCSGAGSKVRDTKSVGKTKFAKSTPGFVTVALQAGKMDVRMLDATGQILHTASIPRNG